MLGQSIKTTGAFVQVIGVICSIVMAIVCWVQGAELADSYRTEEIGGFVIFVGFVFLVVGILVSVIMGIFITGFGDLVENSEITKNSLLNIERRIECSTADSKIKNNVSAQSQSQAYTNSVQSFSQTDVVNTTAQKLEQTMDVVDKQKEEMSQMWKCSNCGNFNLANTNECMNCHTKR